MASALNKSVKWYTVHEAVERFRVSGHPEVNSRRVVNWAKTRKLNSKREKNPGDKVSILYVNASDVDRYCKSGMIPGDGAGNIRLAYDDAFIEDLAVKLLAWINQADADGKKRKFLILEFCEEHMLHEQRMQEFCDRSQLFSEAYKTARAIQESRVVRLGFVAKNPMFPMFFLNSVHDYRQKSESKGTLDVTEKKVFKLGDVEIEL